MAAATLLALGAGAARAEDGYDLWLRYTPLPAAGQGFMSAHATAIIAPGSSDTVRVAVDELRRGFGGMTGHAPERAAGVGAGAILLATPDESPDVAALKLPLVALGKEGFLIR